MGSFGYIAGGLLQGAGEGLAKQGQIDAQTRHEAAMEALRAKRQEDQTRLTADLNDRNAARDDERTLNRDKAKAQTDLASDRMRREWETDAQVRVATVKANLDRTNDEAAQRLKADIDSGVVTDTIEGKDGKAYLIYRNGRTQRTDVDYAPRASQSSDDSIGAALNRRNGKALAAPDAAAPAPDPAKVYTKGEYDAGLSRYAMTQNRAGKTADQIKREWDQLLRAKGYRLGPN